MKLGRHVCRSERATTFLPSVPYPRRSYGRSLLWKRIFDQLESLLGSFESGFRTSNLYSIGTCLAKYLYESAGFRNSLVLI